MSASAAAAFDDVATWLAADGRRGLRFTLEVQRADDPMLIVMGPLRLVKAVELVRLTTFLGFSDEILEVGFKSNASALPARVSLYAGLGGDRLTDVGFFEYQGGTHHGTTVVTWDYDADSGVLSASTADVTAALKIRRFGKIPSFFLGT